MLHGETLPAWLDVIAQHEIPAVICLEKTVETAPHARHPMADRRIGLLALEQNAWVLAGMDKRCVVVDSRTEMDWAMKHGQLSVWAPSKIVLDSVEQPKADAETPEALALWFAQEFAASKLVIVGGTGGLATEGLDVAYLDADTPTIS